MPALPPILPPKKDVLLALLERSSVFVHLDPRREGVRVPEWFKKQPQLILQIGLNLPVPIRDLIVDDEAVSCTLSFSRSPHPCYLPWPAVYALVGEDGRGMVWPDDVPREVAAQRAAEVPQGRDGKKKRARPGLRAVGPSPAEEPGDGESPEEPRDAEPASPPDAPAPPAEGAAAERPRPPYLRVVK